LFALAILAFQAAGEPQPQAEIPLGVRVNHAIAAGVDHLKKGQRPDGTWPGEEELHPGGVTALVGFTLLRSGVRKDDPSIVRACTALGYQKFRSVYSAAVHLLFCDALRDPARTAEAQISLDFLLDNRTDGVWAYPWGHVDNSNTQFALLGLRAARRLGLEVPVGVWLDALDGLGRFQDEGGGSFYSDDPKLLATNQHEPCAGMTAATLAGFAVLQEAAVDEPRLRAALQRAAKRVERAQRWLETSFDLERNHYEDGSYKANWHEAYLWAVERWCGLTDRARIAERDWYSEGARILVGKQERNGSWDGARGPERTCFALLFLRRATLTLDEELPRFEAELARARSKAPDPPSEPGAGARRLTRWWLAGPWNQTGGQPLLVAPPFEPGEVRPKARGKLARRDWERVDLVVDRWTDLERLTGSKGREEKGEEKDRLWVLSTWLTAPAGTTLGALLWLELDDGWDVWLDGRSLSRERRRGGLRHAVSVPVRVEPGAHLLTVLVEDRDGPAAFGALLTGADNGPPPAELRDVLEPESGPK